MPLAVSPLARLRRLVLALVVIVLVTGCSSAFRDAMDRGDDFAKAGQWDDAAAAYKEATSIDPDDEDARAKLRWARREQAKVRVAMGVQLMQEGNAKEALTPLAEAVKLDPTNTYASQALGDAMQMVITQAKAALGSGHFRDAYDLSRAVLLVDPSKEEARTLELMAKEKISQAAFERGQAAETKGLTAVALVEYGESLQFNVNNAQAKERTEALGKTLRDQVTFYVALKNFDGDKSADDFGSDVNASVLAKGLDPALPLRVIDRMPKDKAQLQGMRLGGVFRSYKFARESTRTTRQCDYVCGKEWVPNPQYATAEANMRSSQQALGMAEGRLSSAKSAVGPAERARDTAKTNYDAKKSEADRAEQDLSKCKSSSGGNSSACSSEEQRNKNAQEQEKLAEAEMRRTERAAQDAKSELSDAESDLSRKKSDASSKKATFESTPPKIEVDKYCTHKYSVETVSVAGEVECLLRGEGLYDTEAILNSGVNGRVARSDETFPAQGGVCAEVAKGDPLTVPSESEMKRLVLASAVAAAQKEILGSYAQYRENYLIQGRTAAIDKRADDATDAFVRYLFTVTNPEDEGASEATQAIVRVRGLDEKAVRIAVFGLEAR